MLPGPSKVPVVVDALLACVRTALPGVQVLDGPEVVEVEEDTVSIGLSDGRTVAGYTSQQTSPGLGMRPMETFVIRCWLSTWSGDTSVRARRERAAQMLAAIEAALPGDEGLAGCADRVEVGPELAWVPVQTEDGAACGIAFDVTGRALR